MLNLFARIPIKPTSLCLTLMTMLWLVIPTQANAQAFTASTLADYGNVSVMEVTGGYDAKNPDGTVNSVPRKAIATEFFRTHKDEYDFLVVFSNFDFPMPDDGHAKAFYMGVKNDTHNIGITPFNYAQDFGSTNDRLQGMIDMGNLRSLATDPMDPKFNETLYILSHELMHRWGAHAKFRNADGSISTALLGRDQDHWSFLLDSGGSLMYGNKWRDNGDGTFTSLAPQRELKFFSPLDLYLMGMIDKSKVPPMLLIDSPGIDPGRLPEAGVTIPGTAKTVTIDDIIAAMGPRDPDSSASQKSFKTAFIYITQPGTFTSDAIYQIENIRNGFVTRHSILTDGQSIVQVAPTSKEDIPVNPGVLPPSTTPRTSPANISEGVQWLKVAQKSDGSWADLPQTEERDTAQAVLVLRNFLDAQANYGSGLQRLGLSTSGNTDFLCRKIEAYAAANQDSAGLLTELLARRNSDGGWGSDRMYQSNPADTALALKALALAGYGDQSVISPAIAYLTARQNSSDEGWGPDDNSSTLQFTAAVLAAFNKYRGSYQLEDRISRGMAFIASRQNTGTDKGFGNSPSTVYDTATAVLVLRELGASMQITNDGLDYIRGQQSGDGSWNSSAFQTAMAIDAVYKATVDPDLSIKTADISFIPATVTSLPANVVIEAKIWNLGQTTVPQAVVALYKDSVTETNRIAEQTAAFPGQQATTVTFSTSIPAGSEYRFYIVVDPADLVKESSKTNNSAATVISVEATYDLEVLPQNITLSANPADMLQDVQLSAQITNKGTMNAYNVQVRYFIDDTASPFEIATQTIDVPAGATVLSTVTWRANRAGVNMPLAVLVDPFNTFAEISKANNQATTTLTVNASTTPNLSISYKDLSIAPVPVNQGGNAVLAVIVKNDGFSPVSNVSVHFYEGIPVLDGALLGTRVLPIVNPGDAVTASIDWTQIPRAGEKIIYIKVDPDNQIQELRKEDNDAFITVDILSLPDLAVSGNSIAFLPAAPKDGDPVTITVTVQNRGDQAVSNVSVRLSESGAVLGSPTIPALSGNSTGTVTLSYSTTGKKGAHTITAIVDPDNAIAEQRKDNNTASRTFGVQDANLWLTEPYFSPNGDGTKDSTQFFFSFESPRTVSVNVINEKAEIVRTFSGPELTNTQSGNIAWDGLNTNGTVVPDGQYRMQVSDQASVVLGSLLVTVDTNRSPLTAAIGTKNLLNSNLTCMLPNFNDEDWAWLPDESGIIFSLSGYHQNSPQYGPGLYYISPVGDIQSIVPAMLSEDDFADPTTWNLSKDGRIAFLSWEYDTAQRRYTEKIWTVDIDGRNLRQLMQYEQTDNSHIRSVKWSPNGKYILYNFGLVYDSDGNSSYELWVLDVETSVKTKIDSGYLTIRLTAEWSPDSSEIAYLVYSYQNGGEDLKVSDILGNKKTIHTFAGVYTWDTPIHWLDDKKLIVEHPYLSSALWLFDASGSSNHIKISDQLTVVSEGGGFISISPDRKSVAYYASPDESAQLHVSDTTGHSSLVHKLNSTGMYCTPRITNTIWSTDSKKILFSSHVDTCGDCPPCDDQYKPQILSFDLLAKKETSVEGSFFVEGSYYEAYPIKWLSDDVSIISADYNNIYVVNLLTGRTDTLVSTISLPWPLDRSVSPQQKFITYYKSVDVSSTCYGAGSRDLWLASSLLNLTTQLQPIKNKSAIILKGIAADLNLGSYQLEYADARMPAAWSLVAPPSNVPVMNDVFTTWVPPYEGTFYVRLTAQDKAGNAAVDKKRVSWGISSSITNIYKSREIFSPIKETNGVKDTVRLHYRVLEPVHLEFSISDEANNLIKTFYKDHAAPTEDSIQWDGTDASLNVVPDGTYKIKIFDYEFFVTVDSTPPRIAASLSSIYKKNDTGVQAVDSGFLAVDLRGYAVDKNLKYWTLEIGAGDNPQDWQLYSHGKMQFAAVDANGVLLDPIQEKTIATFNEDSMPLLIGSKLRLTVEDYAFNKSTAITGYLEEKIIFDRYFLESIGKMVIIPASAFDSPGSPILGMGDAGRHVVGGLATLRAPLASLNVQYGKLISGGISWTDASPVMIDPVPGMFTTEWVNPGVEAKALRIKAVDIQGNEHYSNIIYTAYVFGINQCTLQGTNDLFEELQLMTLKISSTEDARYSQPTDIKVSKPPFIPKGIFNLLLPHDLLIGKHYSLQLTGIGVSGKVYSGSAAYPPAADSACAKELPSLFTQTLDVKYQEADCGLSTGKADIEAKLSIKNLGAPVTLKSLSYYLQKPSGPELVRRYDLTRESSGGVAIDTQALPEGSYTVKAVLSYTESDGAAPVELSTEGTVIVDRTAPSSLITYPSGTSLVLCPLVQHGTQEAWYGIPVEGVGTDNIAVSRYELYYGIGEKPDTWLPATDRSKIGPDNSDGQIIGMGAVKGRIGTWDVSKLKGGTYTLKLRVIDVAGNANCSYATFSFDSSVDVVISDRSRRVISPNGDGAFDTVTVDYGIDKYATVDAKVYKVISSPTGSILDATPVRTIATGIPHLGGTSSMLWDGKNDAFVAVADGPYGVAILAKDACGNTAQRWVLVEVDNTPPSIAIAYPQPGNALGNIVEVRGSANDLHFQSSILEVGEVSSPELWSRIATNAVPVSNSMLGKWSTFGLQGTWAIRLTALDTAGNQAVTSSVIDLGMRQYLIKDLSTTPRFFSPNNDGALDTTTVQYELTDACNVMIEFVDASGAVRRTATTSAPALGVYIFVWDGKDGSGLVVPDGMYTVRLTAALASNTAITQTEMNTVVVDATLPAIDIREPVDGSYLKSDVTVTGSINDANLKDYSVTNSGNGTSTALDSGNQNRPNYVFGTMSGLIEGNYTLTVKTSDLAGNAVQKNISYTIDRTPPAAKLDTPKNGEYYGGAFSSVNSQPSATITITGSLVEKNLDTFNLRYGLGDAPAQWIDLITGTTVTAYPASYSWKVGRTNGMPDVPDGLYALSLFAKDKAGLTGEARVKVIVDNTAPTVAVTAPKEAGYAKVPMDIAGTADDLNLDKYAIELSEGRCESAYKWGAIGAGAKPVQNSVLLPWKTLPQDGEYCLKLAASDKSGNKAETKINFNIDTHPPAAPVLSGKADNRTTASLTWTANTEPDLAGYNVYRNGQKVNTALIPGVQHPDENLSEGAYTYTVKAQDLAGWESPASNEVKIKIDLTGPTARINSPQNNARVNGLNDIKGTAYSADDFKQYRVYVGQGAAPSTWTLIRTSPIPISYGTLAPWDTLGLAEGQLFSLKLEAEDTSGNVTLHQISVTVDNMPPAAPLMIAASAVVSDVTITWRANTETDLAGYLLYRNDQLANVAGIVVGNMQPYLIKDTTYVDKGRPDGTFRYYLFAMDQAGNLSDQSNVLEVTIDTRPPHAAIIDPQDEGAFEKKIMVKAESPDLDIASVQFQYQSIQSSPTTTTDWINIGSSITGATLATYLDPAALGLAYGDYRLRAAATDAGLKSDPTPSFITVTYTDLTPPSAASGLNTLATGGTATLTWTANTESDLDGYNIYRTTGGVRTKINSAVIRATSQPSYLDSGLADDTYTYDVTAVDIYKNESKPSGPASARIYAPVITQPYTPTSTSTIQVKGTNITENASVLLSAITTSGFVSAGTATADPTGAFTVNAALTLGENRLSARATDSAGNISKESSIVVVVYDVAPGAPTGAAASVNGSNVHLTWDRNPEPSVLGYNVYRDGVKLNGSDALDTSVATVTASSWRWPGYPYYLPARAVDSSLGTSWMPGSDPSPDNPVWWELDLPVPQLIRHIDIHWGGCPDVNGNTISCAGKDYEIQAWSGYAWITLSTVKGNTERDNGFEFTPAYRTDRIRIRITDSTDMGGWKEMRLAEVNIRKDNLVTPAGPQPAYDDLGLPNKQYDYTLTAVNSYGFESLPTGTVSAVVNIPLPSAPALSATALNSDVVLSWTASTDPGIVSYNVYKNTNQGWSKIGSASSLETTYLEASLINGTYTYRLTAMDGIGNEGAPSTEAAATVLVIPAQAVNLNVVPTPEGWLNASWVYNGDPAAGYNLYRSLTAGGPYARVNSGLIDRTNYLDTGLTSGVTYFYVVTAVDPIGNEGAYSNEASGTPSVTAAPSKPVLFFPTVAGLPVTLFAQATDISGSTVPGSSVTLMNSGLPIGTATALLNDDVQSIPVDLDGNASAISPDGKTLAYTSNDSIWLKSLVTGMVIQAAPATWCYSLVWSPDSSKIAYTYLDSSWNDRIGIYDTTSGSTTLLLDGASLATWDPSWSSDGKRIAFIQWGLSDGVWIKDLVTGTATQIISSTMASRPEFSRDGRTLAYFDNNGLYLYDLTTGASQLIDDNTDAYWLAWSYDGTKLAFVSYRNGTGDVYILETASGNQVLVPGSSDYPYYLAWTADDRYVMFNVWDATNNKDTLWKADVRALSQPTRIMPDLQYVYYFGSARSGMIAVVEENIQGTFTTYLLNPAGRFSFNAVALVPGENIFTGTASNSRGNSDPSDAISVTFDTSLTPDLAVSTDDVYLYPPYPIAGDRMAVNAVVWNTSQKEITNVDVVIYMWNALNQLEQLKSETIPAIAAGSSAVVTATWDSTGKTGTNRLVVVVDPYDTIAETYASNNMAIRDFYVADHAGMALNTATDFLQYGSNQNVNIGTTIWNTGPATNAVLFVRIEDANGNAVSTFDPAALSLAYAAESAQNLIWNTRSTYAGPYVVHAVLKDVSGNTLAEHTIPFTIVPDVVADLMVVTDKIAYGPQQNVITGFTIRNSGTNSIIPTLQAKVSITDAAGTVLFSEAKMLSNILPGSSVDMSSLWNTGLNVPGMYTATVETSFNGGQTITKSAAFTIQGTVVLTGSITASPSVVAFGNSTAITYALANTGTLDAQGYTLRVSIIDPETQAVVQTLDRSADIAANTSTGGQITVSTAGYDLKTYAAVLQTVAQGTAKTIASSSFAVKDLAPPVVTITSPAANGTYDTTILLSASASDDASGVDRVEYQLDGGAWNLLAVVDPSQARYGMSWEPTSADNGPHTVSFRATDRTGNTSLPSPVSFAVQISTALPTAVITGTPSSPTNSTDATLTIGGTDVVAYRYKLDSGVYSPETAVSTPIALAGLAGGDHAVWVIGRNAAGSWQPEVTATVAMWTVDITPPALAISALADGSITNDPTMNVAGTATDNISVQGVTINGTAVLLNPVGTFSQAVSLTTGSNTITTIASDIAGNTTTDVRTIILDQTAPVITIASPTDNSIVSNPSITVSGTTDKPTTVLVSINSGPTVTAAVNAATFSLPVTLASNTNNTIFVYAIDLAGNSGTAKRSVTHDDISPALAVTNPAQDMSTNQPGILLQGTVTDIDTITVTVALDGTTYTPVVTNGSFQQQLTFTEEKQHQVIVTATDAAGNSTTVQRNIIFDKTPPGLTIDPVTTPTSIRQQTVTGTRELNSTVTVACPTALISVVSTPSPTVWQVVIADMAEGENVLSVTATDQVGNNSLPFPATIVLDTHAPVTEILSGPLLLTRVNAALFTFTAPEPATFGCSLDGAAFSACTSPLAYANLPDGIHVFKVRATDTAGNPDPNPAIYAWQVDTVAPVAVIAGTPASPTNARSAMLTVTGDDVIAYKYHIDGDSYSPETPATVPILLSALQGGTHTVFVVARDSAGNWQPEAHATTEAWTVDITPPALSLSTLPDGSYTNNGVLNVAGAASDANGIQSILVSGQTITPSTTDNVHYTFNHAVSLATGTNTLTTTAMDNAGNTTVNTRTIILDLTAPVVTITDPADNSLTNSAAVNVTGFVDKTALVSIKVNGISSLPDVVTSSTFTFSVTLAYNGNQIDVTAVDLANNSGSAKRSVTLDNLNPALAITSPNQDMGTNRTDILLGGTMSDLTAVSLIVTCPTASIGVVSTPTSTTWNVSLTNMQQGTNTITVQATDETGNSTSVMRNIIVSQTPVTIDPVRTPTNSSQQLITGTMDLNSTVTVSCASATLGMVTYPTPTTWQAIIAGMAEGTNVISATATDLEDRTSDPVAATIVLDTHAPATTPSPASGIYYNGLTATLAADEPATTYFTTDGSTPTSSSTIYSGPIVLTSTTTLQFFSVDLAGNAEAVKTAAYTVIADTTPPATTMTPGTPNYTSVGGQLSVTSASLVSLSATDDISGVKSTAYRIDSGTWNTFVSPFSLVSEGSHTIGFRSTDYALNTEAEKSIGVVVDNTPPVSTIAVGGPPVTPSTAITITATDSASGVKLTEYNVDGAAWTAYSGSFTLAAYSQGTHTINYRSTDNIGNIETPKSRAVQLWTQSPTVTTTALSDGTAGAAYSQTLAATGGTAPYTWSVATGTLPSGLLLNTTAGTISGTPLSAGTTTITFQATDVNLMTGTRVLSITIYGPVSITTSSLASGTTGSSYSQTLAATGGKTPYIWSTTTGTLPAGLSLNGSTGVVSGTPTTAGTSTVAFQVKDAHHATAAKVLAITINTAQSIPQNFGVFGATGITMSGGYVDSYDSTQGAYTGAHGSNVSIGTNAISSGAISLSGGVVDYGNAYVGPGGNPASAIVMSGGSVIYGTKAALSAPRNMTPRTDPGGGTPASFTNGTTLTTGTYRVSSINLSGSGKGTINGNVALIVTGSVNLSGSSQIVILPGGSLTLYLGGSLNVSGGSIVNQSLNPHNLTIYGTSTCKSVGYSGTSALYGVIYTPAATISISGGVNVYGAVIGKSVAMSGGSAVHYDVSLGSIGN